MRKIFLAYVLGMFVVYGAGSVENSASLSQNAEYKIVQIIVSNEILQAPEDAIFGINGTQIYGNTGCNSYFTDFRRIDNKTIEISTNGGSTKMMCNKMANKFEYTFLQNLVGKFSVADNGNELSLLSDKMQVVLKK